MRNSYDKYEDSHWLSDETVIDSMNGLNWRRLKNKFMKPGWKDGKLYESFTDADKEKIEMLIDA